MTTVQFERPHDKQFGFTTRQLNLAMVRLQELLARLGPLEDKELAFNVAQEEEDQPITVPLEPMSTNVVLYLVTQLIAANNSALTTQLLDLGLEPRTFPGVPSIHS